jgi:hypothetical protein
MMLIFVLVVNVAKKSVVSLNKLVEINSLTHQSGEPAIVCYPYPCSRQNNKLMTHKSWVMNFLNVGSVISQPN